MPSHRLRVLRHVTIGTLAVLALLMTTALTGAARTNVDGPTKYRDCWLGSRSHYDECVQANNWGSDVDFPDWQTEYRDCWLGSPAQYDACVEANNWGANFLVATDDATSVFPDRDDASLVVGGIPSY